MHTSIPNAFTLQLSKQPEHCVGSQYAEYQLGCLFKNAQSLALVSLEPKNSVLLNHFNGTPATTPDGIVIQSHAEKVSDGVDASLTNSAKRTALGNIVCMVSPSNFEIDKDKRGFSGDAATHGMRAFMYRAYNWHSLCLQSVLMDNLWKDVCDHNPDVAFVGDVFVGLAPPLTDQAILVPYVHVRDDAGNERVYIAYFDGTDMLYPVDSWYKTLKTFRMLIEIGTVVPVSRDTASLRMMTARNITVRVCKRVYTL